MRKLLYRGKCECTDEWVYGAPVGFMKEKYSEVKYEVLEKCGIFPIPPYWNRLDQHLITVDPETLTPWTGLKDQDGTMIFEGDIINGGSVDFIVEWSQEDAGFVARPVEEYAGWWPPVNTITMEKFRVVGNVFDEIP